jgi:hypothetical protein
MSFSPNLENIVARGTYLYDSTVECDLCIVYSRIRYGSGDCNDSPEIANDLDVDAYYLWFGSTTERDTFIAGGEGFSSVKEARMKAYGWPGIGSTVRWK